ncbi:MAG: DUF4832 domain-containing protein [Anaerolineae bacterium]|nr:DUF4832 domain-containing protein [Anaerolineae bacterium]
MEFFYVPLRNLMNGAESFTFESGMEPQLQSIASRGHQAVLRVYLDYPSKRSGIPQFLLDGGLEVHKYTFFGNSLRDVDSVSPNYDDPKLISALEAFIAAFGHRYDGDPRIGFIQLGLVGFWGEWHTWPMDGFKQETSVYKALPDPKEENWMPSDKTQERIIKAYDDAFNSTRLLLRYPMLPPNGQSSGPGRFQQYGSFKYNVGYHDDSFAYTTLFGEDWYFMGKMEWSGGIDKWKTEPIGGELRPEIQLSVWADPQTRRDTENFAASVDGTHVSWLIAHALFTTRSINADTPVYKAALAGAQRMGYEFTVNAVNIPDTAATDPLVVDVRIQNTGVAPFYYDWPLELGVVDAAGTLVATFTPDWKLSSLLPAESGKLYTDWTYSNPSHGLTAGSYTLVLRVVNPLPNGKALRFANLTQDATLAGWLTLGPLNVQ